MHSLLRRLSLAAALLVAPAAGAQPADPQPQYPSTPMPVAVLQGLDKITARIYTFEAPVDQTIGFGTLKVTVRVCRKRPPEYPPESAAYLEIVEQRPEQQASALFNGWMFASSPGLNPLEHPVYDVWVIDCKTSSGGASGGRQ
ncbi:MAG: DUF2155 domain-containing protein [Ferrovibrio sp.]|uniref:DUF2155 domain-containing protein n=1 Tax=Ferrovibrio sp. TaxID=1917215 RepID=UPI00391AF435